MTSDALMRMGERIRAHRVATGMKQSQVAGQAGLTRSSIANIEAGRHDPPVTRLLAIAKALGVPATDLIAGAETARELARDPLERMEAENRRLRKQLAMIRAAVELAEETQ